MQDSKVLSLLSFELNKEHVNAGELEQIVDTGRFIIVELVGLDPIAGRRRATVAMLAAIWWVACKLLILRFVSLASCRSPCSTPRLAR